MFQSIWRNAAAETESRDKTHRLKELDLVYFCCVQLRDTELVQRPCVCDFALFEPIISVKPPVHDKIGSLPDTEE
jgi:hypothetical protein